MKLWFFSGHFVKRLVYLYQTCNPDNFFWHIDFLKNELLCILDMAFQKMSELFLLSFWILVFRSHSCEGNKYKRFVTAPFMHFAICSLQIRSKNNQVGLNSNGSRQINHSNWMQKMKSVVEQTWSKQPGIRTK